MGGYESKLLSCADANIPFLIELIEEELLLLAKAGVLGLFVLRLLLLLHLVIVYIDNIKDYIVLIRR